MAVTEVVGGDDVPLLKGLDGVLKSQDAASQAIKEAATELRVVAQRTGQYGIGAEAKAVAEGIADRAEREALYSQIVAAGGDPDEAARYTGSVPSSASTAPPPASPPPPSAGQAPEAAPPPPPAGRTPQEEYEYYKNYFGGKRDFSLRNLRRDVGERIMSSTETPWGQQLYESPEGEWVDQDGNFASSAALMAFMRRERIAGAARGVGQSLAKGSSFRAAGLGAAPGIIARGAGVAGAALMAGQKAGEFFEDQRAANAEWQAIYGGSNLGAVGQRFSQRLFGLSQFGFMDSQQAEQLFRSVSQTGLQGDERQGALDFATNMYGQLGMSVSQSVKLIQLAVETGNESLAGFAGAIKDVSESAVEAGVNAEKARELFIQTVQQTTGQFGPGYQSTQLASALTAEQVGLGPEFMGMNINLLGPDVLRRLQSRTGMSYNQLLQMGGQDAGELLNMAIPFLVGDLQRFISPEGVALVQQGFADGRSASEIALEVLPYVIDAEGLVTVLNQSGLITTRDPFEAVMFLVAMVGDQINPSERITEQAARAEVGQIAGEGQAALTGRRDYLQGLEDDNIFLEKGGFFGTGMFGNARNQSLNKAFRAHIQRTGQTGGVVEELFRGQFQSGIEEVVIQTKEGPKVFSLEDAIRYHGDEINAGNAVIYGGEQSGKTISEVVTGGHADPTASDGSSTEGASRGTPLAEAQRRDGGEVTLGLTPEARRILQPVNVRGVSWDDYYTQADPHRTQDSYATGNP